MHDGLTSTLQAVTMTARTDSLVSCSRNGTPYRSFRTAFETAVQKAGLADFTFHDLRHTFASCLVMSEVDLPTVKELLEHKDISMTLRYTHLSTDHKQQAVHRLEHFGEKAPHFHHRAAKVPTEYLQVIEK